MPTVLLTHTHDMLANYYGDRALAALRGLCDVRLNDTGKPLDTAALVKLSQGCEIIVSDRLTAGPADFSPRPPRRWPLSSGSPWISETSTSPPRRRPAFW